jgi:hypothetical protein
LSEIYEGVVFLGDPATARAAFRVLASPLHLRLVMLTDDVSGVYRVANRDRLFDVPNTEQVACQLSGRVGRAVALFYDNRGGAYFGVLYVGGRRVREFGEEDEWWVPYGDDGEIQVDGPRFRPAELQEDEEYDRVFSAIDAALEAIPVGRDVDASLVKDAFCYVFDESGWLEESGSLS